VPLISFSGASPAYSNRYSASHQYNYQPKHNPPLFFEDTNGGTDAARNNPMVKNYARGSNWSPTLRIIRSPATIGSRPTSTTTCIPR
jgi:hypothetical protein